MISMEIRQEFPSIILIIFFLSYIRIYVHPRELGKYQVYKEAEVKTHHHTGMFPSRFCFLSFVFSEFYTQFQEPKRSPRFVKLCSLPFFFLSHSTISLGRYHGIFLRVSNLQTSLVNSWFGGFGQNCQFPTLAHSSYATNADPFYLFFIFPMWSYYNLS